MAAKILTALDKEFSNIWRDTSKLPSALAAWQSHLTEALKSSLCDPADRQLVQQYLEKWNKVLLENRQLLAFHVEQLTGEPVAPHPASDPLIYHPGKNTKQ